MNRKQRYFFSVLLAVMLGWQTPIRATASQLLADSIAPPKAVKTDSLAKLTNFIRRGHFFGHARMYWMGTNNRAELQDYHALALGAGIGYRTPRIAGHIELGLFNLLQPDDREDLDRLEELYVRYHFGSSSRVTVGRQIPASPFFNSQDGRMCPILTEGVVLEWNEWKHTRIRAEYLIRISHSLPLHGPAERSGCRVTLHPEKKPNRNRSIRQDRAEPGRHESAQCYSQLSFLNQLPICRLLNLFANPGPGM